MQKFGPWKIWNNYQEYIPDSKQIVQIQRACQTRAEAENSTPEMAAKFKWFYESPNEEIIICYREVLERTIKKETIRITNRKGYVDIIVVSYIVYGNEIDYSIPPTAKWEL